MKVLAVVPSLNRGGAERVVSWLTEEWAASHDVTVCVFRRAENGYPISVRLINLDVPNHPNWLLKPVGMLRRIRALTGILRRTDPDIIIGFMESANMPLLIAALATGRGSRLTLSVHNNPGRFRWVFRVFMGLCYGRARRIVTVSAGVREYLVERLGLARAQITVIHNPLNLREIDAASGADQPVEPRELGPYVFAAGRFVPQKDFPRMLRLFSRVRDVNHLLVLAGDGPDRAACEALAVELGIAERVRFIGRVANPFVWMAHADAFLLTSRFEGWGNVLAEAMACGCPVVTFDCEFGPAELTANGACGVLVPIDDDDTFIAGLTKLLGDETQRQRLRALGRERVAALDVRVLAPRWIDAAGQRS